MKLYFDDENFDGQLQRSIGKADSCMANVGECLAIAERITPGDRDSWYRAWSGFATHLAEQGQAALAAGHRVSARSVLLRASEYFRQAFFYHRDNLDGAELQTAYASSVQAFRDALPLLDHHAEVLPDGLSGYLFTPGSRGRPAADPPACRRVRQHRRRAVRLGRLGTGARLRLRRRRRPGPGIGAV